MQSRVCALTLLAAWIIATPFPLAAASVGNADAGKAKAGLCAGCHGADGNGGADPTWPKLAGQTPEYLVTQLQRFKSGARDNAIMKGMASTLSDQDMRDIAAFYAAQAMKRGTANDKTLALRGQRIYRGGIVDTGVPACMSCHGPAGHGIPPHYPRLDSQSAAYVQKQLSDFRAQRRASIDPAMPSIASRLTDADIRAISEYLSGLH
ncbi:MAG TPA: c-type cytochrome [Burkholderiales bacterium]|jgi:cytochrome c553